MWSAGAAVRTESAATILHTGRHGAFGGVAVTASEDVRRYYDANTRKFLLAGSQRAIHRELWGPGVTSRSEAAHHAHALVLDELRPEDRRVLDLGCGVGTAALYLAGRRPVEVLGISISPEQIRLA